MTDITITINLTTEAVEFLLAQLDADASNAEFYSAREDAEVCRRIAHQIECARKEQS